MLKKSRLEDVCNIGLCQQWPPNTKPRIRPAHQGTDSPAYNHGSFLVEREPSEALYRHAKSKIREETAFTSSYLSRTPSLEEVGGRKGQIRTPWLMNVQRSTMNRSHLHPLPSQQSIDQHFSTFFPPWHIKQVKFTHRTH